MVSGNRVGAHQCHRIVLLPADYKHLVCRIACCNDKRKNIASFFLRSYLYGITLLADILLGVGIFPGVVIRTIKDFLLIG